MTTNNNLAIFEAVCETDPKFTKNFSRGGGFKGTAISAPYLVRKATEVFGPCGIGWGYDVDDERYQAGADGEVIHVLRLKLWYMHNGQRGEITHFGQTTFVGKNKNGAFTDEEAPKKSLTDGLTKALSMLGFAFDVHSGLYDDNKYINDLKEKFEAKANAEAANKPLTDEQQKALVKPILARVKAGELSYAAACTEIDALVRVTDEIKSGAKAKALQLSPAPADDLPDF